MSKSLAMTKFMQPIVKVSKNTLRFISKNSNVILTMISATGVIVTTIVAIKGTIKAVKLCEEKKVSGTKEVIETVWKCYIPTIGLAILTTTAILCNGKINAKRLAVLTSAYSGSVETIKKIEEKMSEQIGPKKTQKAVDEAEAELAKEHAPKNQKDIIATGKGNKLFFCASTGQWFYSDWNGVELAEAKLTKIFEEKAKSWGVAEFVHVSEAQEVLDLPITDMGSNMGWDIADFIESNDYIHFVISSEWMDLPWGREMVGVVRFTPWPINI